MGINPYPANVENQPVVCMYVCMYVCVCMYICLSYCKESGYFQTNVHLYSRVSRSPAVQSECSGRQESLPILVCS